MRSHRHALCVLVGQTFHSLPDCFITGVDADVFAVATAVCIDLVFAHADTSFVFMDLTVGDIRELLRVVNVCGLF